MKKLLALVLAMVLLLSVAGCAQVSPDEGCANNNGYYGGYNDMMNGNNGGYESPNNDNYNDTYQDSYNNDSGNQNSSNNTNNGSSSNNSSNGSSSSSSSGASSSNTAQVPVVIYEKVVEDKHHYGNKATIDKIDVSGSGPKRFIYTYRID